MDPKRKIKIDVKRQVELLCPGDLICVEWCDASVGQSSRGGARAIDVPVRSWGIFIGVLGAEAKHIVLAQNSFRYSDGLFDLDYTAIPLSWTIDFSVLIKGLIPKDTAGELVNSFLLGGHRTLRRTRTFQRRIFQQRLSVESLQPEKTGTLYSYLVKYNGLFASLRLSKRGMSLKDTTSTVMQLPILRALSGSVKRNPLSVTDFLDFLTCEPINSQLSLGRYKPWSPRYNSLTQTKYKSYESEIQFDSSSYVRLRTFMFGQSRLDF